MGDEKDTARQRVVKRIFITQILLIATILALVIIAHDIESKVETQDDTPAGFGFFWYAFLAGCMGGSVGLLRRATVDDKVVAQAAPSVVSTLMPFLYGGIMAGVAYLLFMSEILAGECREGLLTSNLFPIFNTPEDGKVASVTAFINTRPDGMIDVGKLMVWCFIAGYSEHFVTGVLGKLQGHAADSE